MKKFVRNDLEDKNNLMLSGPLKTCLFLLAPFILITSLSCGPQKPKKPPATYTVPISQLEQDYGQLITVANMPTTDQNGTGDRLGLFQDENGTFWGIPLTRNENGMVVGCAPEKLSKIPVSDTLPADTAEIVGAANEPTNWRGGTGNLELLLRNNQDGLVWYSVKEGETKLEPACWSQSDPIQQLPFYRLVIQAGENKNGDDEDKARSRTINK